MNSTELRRRARRTPARALLAVALGLPALLGLTASAGCSSAADGPTPGSAPVREGPASASPTLSSPAPPSTAPSSAASTTPTDAAWVQLMTPMNQQAVKLLELAADRAAEPRLRSFATRLRTGQEAELGRLRTLLARMGLPDTDVHAGHDMPGMVTERDLEAAASAGGAAFDRLLLTEVRDHLRQSAQVSRSEVASGGRADARRLADTLVTAREASLAELERLPGAGRALG